MIIAPLIRSHDGPNFVLMETVNNQFSGRIHTHISWMLEQMYDSVVMCVFITRPLRDQILDALTHIHVPPKLFLSFYYSVILI